MQLIVLTAAAALGGVPGAGMDSFLLVRQAAPIEWVEDWAPPPVDDQAFAQLAVDGCDLTLDDGAWNESWLHELRGMPAAVVVENGHTERNGDWLEYEQIPRRRDRPESYFAYRYPIIDGRVVSGYDLDLPDERQRRGTMNAVGHGGVDLAADLDTPIVMVPLEHQVGDAEVLYVGWLFGETVVTRHTLRESGRDHDYLLLFGHLDRVADGVRRGVHVEAGAPVGFVGNSGSPEHVHLHLEARRVRDGVDAWTLPGEALDAREYSVVSDPRNVLPLRFVPRGPRRCSLRPATVARRYWLGGAMKLTIE